MKIYKTYFSKDDTPFRQEFQANKQYHVVWKRRPYKTFLGHKVVKVKLFGLFNIYVKKDAFEIIDEFLNSHET